MTQSSLLVSDPKDVQAPHSAPRSTRVIVLSCLYAFLGSVVVACGGGGGGAAAPDPAPNPVTKQMSLQAVGPVGGPFLISGDTLTVENTSGAGHDYVISCDQDWVTWDVQSVGTIAAGETLGMQLAIDAGRAPKIVGSYAAVITVLGVTSESPVGTIALDLDVNPIVSGWTELVPSADSRLIYVSSGTGDDANSGLSEAAPKRTLAAGYGLMRDGFPDYLHLKRGDTWTNEGISCAKSGRSLSERMVFTTYGTSSARPRLINGGFDLPYRLRVDHVAVVGLHLERVLPASITSGISCVGFGDNLLLEDCYVAGFRVNVVLQGEGGQMRNVAVRRCILVDAYSLPGDGHSQGLFAGELHGGLIEENLLDHNGWSETVSGAVATQYNHNVYLYQNCSGIVFKGNISANAASHGVQLRNGGTCLDNLFIGNPINLLLGYRGDFDTMKSPGLIEGNVIIDSRDISSENPRAFGIWITNASGVRVLGNLIAHQENGNMPEAVRVDEVFEDILFERNVVYNWSRPAGDGWALNLSGQARGGVEVRDNEFQQANSGRLIDQQSALDHSRFTYFANKYYTADATDRWFRLNGQSMSLFAWAGAVGETGASGTQVTYSGADRDVASYWASLGGTGGRAGFLAAVRGQSKANWNPALTAGSANTYMRAGFGIASPVGQ